MAKIGAALYYISDLHSSFAFCRVMAPLLLITPFFSHPPVVTHHTKKSGAYRPKGEIAPRAGRIATKGR